MLRETHLNHDSFYHIVIQDILVFRYGTWARLSTDWGLESIRFFLFLSVRLCPPVSLPFVVLVLMGVAFYLSDHDSDFDSALFSLCHRSYPQPVHCFPIRTSTYFFSWMFSLFLLCRLLNVLLFGGPTHRYGIIDILHVLDMIRRGWPLGSGL